MERKKEEEKEEEKKKVDGESTLYPSSERESMFDLRSITSKTWTAAPFAEPTVANSGAACPIDIAPIKIAKNTVVISPSERRRKN